MVLAGATQKCIHAQVGAKLPANEEDVVASFLYKGQDETTFKQHLERSLGLQSSRMMDDGELTDEQRRKLEFAVKGDLNRFYRDLEVAKTKAEGLSMRDRVGARAAYQIVGPLFQTLDQPKGILGEGSLCSKVINSLSSEQRALLRAAERDRKQFMESALRQAALSDLEQSMFLSATQREKILGLLEKISIEARRREDLPRAAVFSFEKLKDKDLLSILNETQMRDFEQYRKRLADNNAQVLGGVIAW